MRRKILLINVDAPEFNIAIRKLYKYYTLDSGVDVTLIDKPSLTGYPNCKPYNIDASLYDKVYASMLYEINQDRFTVTGCDNVVIGGIGSINPGLRLPDHIESTQPHYFDGETIAHGFITRGCTNKCYFCKVPKYEGELKAYNSLSDIYDASIHKSIRFYDNNILAYYDHKKLFTDLIDIGVKCDFNQGLDFRLATDDNMYLLSKLKYKGEYIFAFDDIAYKHKLNEKLKTIKKYIKAPWKLKFYIYHNEKTMELKDTISRVEWCRENEALPYIMRDANCWESANRTFLIEYARYCNQPQLFKTMPFTQAIFKLTKTVSRINLCVTTYNNNKPI